MEKIDFRKAMRPFYDPPVGRFEIVDLPPMSFFMIDGKGDPNRSPDYAQAVAALYAVSYTLKFVSKHALGRDYVVPPLEGLWWADDMESFKTREKEKWPWTMMIMVPDFVEPEMAREAIAAAAKKKDLPALGKLRVQELREGRAAQTMHVGSYDSEGPILAYLHDQFLPANGLVESGFHHEIYLGDPRRTVPEKLRTVLRQPVMPRE
ncbi:MAG TPA: GyrI-like domain-containing protein [Rhizobiaceae bacterium]|nr:GyrI-like domain-containing protein [Rhizobiaceae bacterium]